MKAARLFAYGDTNQIRIETIAHPSVGRGEILVNVAASSLNHVETYIRQGYLAQMIPLELPATLGIDLAGEVEEVGEGVTRFKKGDRVIGRLAPDGKGSHAECVVTAEHQLAHLPANVSFEAGATIPLVGLTGRQAVNAVHAKPGDRVLVIGALGNVGRVAIQYLGELGIIGIAGVQASQVFDAESFGMVTVVAGEVTEADSFDAVVDTVGGDIALAAMRALKDGGTIASTAFVPEGANADGRVKLVNVMSGDDQEMLQKLADAAGRGDLHLPIARTFPLEELAAAYDCLATRPEGKIVVTR